LRTLEERFWSKVAIGAPGECWEWQRGRKPDGYGQFKLISGGSPQRAHRIAWLLTFGDPGALYVLHRCDNPPCCNPAHLFLGTAAVNNADKIAKGRQAAAGHESFPSLVAGVRRLTDAQICKARHQYAGGRSCRSIARESGVSHTTISRLVNGTHWRGYRAA